MFATVLGTIVLASFVFIFSFFLSIEYRHIKLRKSKKDDNELWKRIGHDEKLANCEAKLKGEIKSFKKALKAKI